MPPDQLFSDFLGQMPKQVCLECLTAIYATTDKQGTAARLRDLGDAIEIANCACSNCEQLTTTYRMRQH